jgi:hypothetical protein
VTPEDAEEYTQSLGQIGGGLWRQVLWAQRMGVPAALGLSLRDWVDNRLGGYVRMAVEERRSVVAQLTAKPEDGGEGLTGPQAAEVIGVSDETVYRDLGKRSTNVEPQDADQQEDAPASTFVEHETDLPDPEADRTDLVQELARQSQPEPVAEPPPLPRERSASDGTG